LGMVQATHMATHVSEVQRKLDILLDHADVKVGPPRKHGLSFTKFVSVTQQFPGLVFPGRRSK